MPFVDRRRGHGPEVGAHGLGLIGSLIGDAEPDVQKALSWALRSLTLVDAPAVAAFVEREATRAAGTSDGQRAWVLRDTLAKLAARCGRPGPRSPGRDPPLGRRSSHVPRLRASPPGSPVTRACPIPEAFPSPRSDRALGDLHRDRRPGRHPRDPHRGRDAGELPRLRDERDRGARPARRPRRPQAGPPPDPLHDGRDGPQRHELLPQVRGDRRRGDGQVPPPRRRRPVRRARPAGPGLLDALPAGRRPGQLRLGRRRQRGRHALHRGAPDCDRRARCSPTSTRRRSTSYDNYDGTQQEPSRPAGQAAEPAHQRLVRASRSAWPPTSRPTTSARSSTRRSP